MDNLDLLETLGERPAMLFGCSPPAEVVGPLKPDSCVYGVMAEMREYNSYVERPIVHINVEDHDRGLPPWQFVLESVFTSKDGNTVTFINMRHEDTRRTNDLKTVTMSAEKVVEGETQTAIIGE